MSLLLFNMALQKIKDNLEGYSGQIEVLLSKKTTVLKSATPGEAERIQEKLTQLMYQWEKVNKMYQDRQA